LNLGTSTPSSYGENTCPVHTTCAALTPQLSKRFLAAGWRHGVNHGNWCCFPARDLSNAPPDIGNTETASSNIILLQNNRISHRKCLDNTSVWPFPFVSKDCCTVNDQQLSRSVLVATSPVFDTESLISPEKALAGNPFLFPARACHNLNLAFTHPNQEHSGGELQMWNKPHSLSHLPNAHLHQSQMFVQLSLNVSSLQAACRHEDTFQPAACCGFTRVLSATCHVMRDACGYVCYLVPCGDGGDSRASFDKLFWPIGHCGNIGVGEPLPSLECQLEKEVGPWLAACTLVKLFRSAHSNFPLKPRLFGLCVCCLSLLAIFYFEF